ncbi:acyl-coenzyme A thioesterase PaaI-like protein [Bradyrhizobium sp. GM5.1]
MLPRGWAASTVDYTIKLVAPASGEKLVARGRLVRSGRTLSVAASDVYAVRQGDETLCATALATIRNFEVPGS